MFIETPRLLLRPWQLQDAPALYKYASDPRVGPRAGWLPHQSPEESATVIQTVFSAPETWALVLKETDEPIGCASISFAGHADMPIAQNEGEIGCWLGAPFWGRGLMPEAVQALVRRSFTELGRSGMWYRYFEGNAQSRRVAEKCGFVYHDTTRALITRVGIHDQHSMYLGKNDWLAQQPAD